MMALPEKDITEVITRYTNRFKEHGYSPTTLGWPKGKQDIRFSILTSMFPIENRSILDVGCGFGDLNKFLSAKYNAYTYLGIDLVDTLINEAKIRYKQQNTQFIVGDFLQQNFESTFDFVVGSGIFNFKLHNMNNYDYVEEVIEKSFKLCKIGLSFDFLSDKVDYIQYDNVFHNNPEKILSIAYKYTRNIVLRNDYMPFEFCLIMFKDDSFDKETTIFNRYKNN